MTVACQGSLLDAGDEVALRPLGSSVRRTALAHGAWIDLRPGWIVGADALLHRLRRSVAWQAEERWMYNRVVAVPRVLSFYAEGERLPHPALDAARAALDPHSPAALRAPSPPPAPCPY